MKDRALIFISLCLSIAALVYAAWVHQHAQAMAEEALRNRERNLVQTLEPKIQQMYSGMGITNKVGNATTLEELFGPYLDVLNNLSAEPSQDSQKKQ